MTKEQFVAAIDALEKQYRHDEKCSDAIRICFADAVLCTYNNDYVTNALVAVLQDAMNDAHKHSWIEYYLYELNFGKDWKKGKVTFDGVDFPLSNAGELWDILEVAKSE